MKWLVLLSLTLLTLTGCTHSSSPNLFTSAVIEPSPSPSSVIDTSQQLLEDLEFGTAVDFESEFDNLARDLE